MLAGRSLLSPDGGRFGAITRLSTESDAFVPFTLDQCMSNGGATAGFVQSTGFGPMRKLVILTALLGPASTNTVTVGAGVGGASAVAETDPARGVDVASACSTLIGRKMATINAAMSTATRAHTSAISTITKVRVVVRVRCDSVGVVVVIVSPASSRR